MVAIVARRDVGADVERVPAAVPFDVVERLFTPMERDALRAAPAAEQPARFAELWTMKEAYAKARGLGLSLPLETIGFALHPPRLVAGDDPSSWQVESTAPTALHRAAVSVRRADAEPLRVVTRWQDA
jgi:4'-phosphopantetheinyl transferase